MPGEEAVVGQEVAVEPIEVSDPPNALFFALAIPVFATLVYMLARVFGGRWIDEDPRDP